MAIFQININDKILDSTLVQSSLMQWSMLAELTGIQDDPSKRPIAALFLAMPPPPQGELVQLLEEDPAFLMDLLDLVPFPT